MRWIRKLHLHWLSAALHLAGLACLPALVGVGPAHAASLTLSFRPGTAEGHLVEGAITARSIDGRAMPVVRAFSCQVIGPCEVDLALPEEHRWVLTVDAPGYWIRGPIPAGTPSVEMFPAGRLNGSAAFPKGTPSPESIVVRFHPATDSGHSTDATFDGMEGESACPIRDGSFTCELPAGLLDFSLRARGHVSIYRWGQRVVQRSTVLVGRLTFRPGASLVGQVTSPDRSAPKPGACRVRIEPGVWSPKLPATAPALSSTTVDDRGFFHLEMIPPGKWDLVVQQEGFAPVRQPVSILEGAEAALIMPVVISRPVRLEVLLDPPQDPEGKPWRVQLTEMNGDRIGDMTTDTPASLSGMWVRENLGASGKYLVQVLTGSRQRWWADDVPFSPEGTPFKKRVFLNVEPVSDRITLGGKPLQGQIVFGKERRSVSVTIQSDEEGKFSGFLPRLGKWPIAVMAEVPTIRREFDVDVRRGENGRGVVEIALADRALHGEIVTEDGSLVPKAILTVRTVGRREHVQHNVEGGIFRFDGLEPGDYLLSADGPGLTSDDVQSTLPAEADPAPARIVLRKRGVLQLQLVSPNEVGVIGAAVWVIEGLSSSKSSYMKATDAAGRVWFYVSPTIDRQCVAVLAPQYAFRLVSLPVTAEEQTIQATPGGGTLTLEYATPSDKGYPLLQHGGCTVTPSLLSIIARRRPETTVENLEPGQYELCIRSNANPSDPNAPCAQGWLAPFGRLNLAPLASSKKN